MTETIRESLGPMGKMAGLAYGLDGATDGDSTRMTAVEKGERMGLAAAASNADLVLPNAETQWDSDQGPDDDMDENGAIAMGKAYRARAPKTVTIDQPWPMPDQHGENRKQVRPIDQGGSFAGFPIDEFASWVDGRAPQVYWANWYRVWGSEAYRKVVAWSEREWNTIETGMRRLDPKLVLPRTATLQGYGHDAYPWTLADYLLRHVQHRPIILWCDPAPTAGTIEIIATVEQIIQNARQAGRTADAQLKDIQHRNGLTPDGILGPKTWAVISR